MGRGWIGVEESVRSQSKCLDDSQEWMIRDSLNEMFIVDMECMVDHGKLISAEKVDDWKGRQFHGAFSQDNPVVSDRET